jgi:uncharacterized protein YggE
MSRVVAAVRGLVAETDIETLNFSVGPRHPPRRTDQDYYSDTLRPIIGYTVSNSVSIVVRDMDKVSEVIDRSIQAGANVVGGINFGVKDIATQIDRARTAAIENARHKATVYATAAGLDLGRALSVSDVPSFGITRIEDVVNQLPQSYAAQDAGPATPVLPSKVRISAAVTVMFAVK